MEYALEIPAGLHFDELGIGSRQKLGPSYHPAIAGPDEDFRGKTWKDMPGSDQESKRMNFFLFRRGLFVLPEAGARKDIRNVFTGTPGSRKGRRAA